MSILILSVSLALKYSRNYADFIPATFMAGFPILTEVSAAFQRKQSITDVWATKKVLKVMKALRHPTLGMQIRLNMCGLQEWTVYVKRKMLRS